MFLKKYLQIYSICQFWPINVVDFVLHSTQYASMAKIIAKVLIDNTDLSKIKYSIHKGCYHNQDHILLCPHSCAYIYMLNCICASAVIVCRMRNNTSCVTMVFSRPVQLAALLQLLTASSRRCCHTGSRPHTPGRYQAWSLWKVPVGSRVPQMVYIFASHVIVCKTRNSKLSSSFHTANFLCIHKKNGHGSDRWIIVY